MRGWRLLSIMCCWVTGCSAPEPTAAEPAAAPLTVVSGSENPSPADTVAAPEGARRSTQEQGGIPPKIVEIVTAPDRSDADRALDEGRHPAQTLAFLGAKPGMKVAEIAAGTGYTAELLARSVAPGGTVYAVNSKWVLDRFAQKPWTDRLSKPVMTNVVRLDRPFDDPFPSDVRDLDLVCIVLFYHDFVWMESDRAKLNAAVMRALKPGGTYVIIDHSAQPGSGTRDAKTLHRIDEDTVLREVREAGFQLVEEGTFLENPQDTRDWSAAPSAAAERRGTSDRFVLKFVKP